MSQLRQDLATDVFAAVIGNVMAEQAFTLRLNFSYHVIPECGGRKREEKVAFWFLSETKGNKYRCYVTIRRRYLSS